MTNIPGSFILHMQIPGVFWNISQIFNPLRNRDFRTGQQSQELLKIADCAGVVDELWSRYDTMANAC
jgi:hypothetical protein